ncbi:hypothetical protein GCM10010468_21930 [Actinocorallia longicatena]|uniref:Uncharacterized protein n=1 Tax=Actinocorallia longicatena TaxID=111803 RepID=A0ABP6Q8X7_9ACTN
MPGRAQNRPTFTVVLSEGSGTAVGLGIGLAVSTLLAGVAVNGPELDSPSLTVLHPVSAAARTATTRPAVFSISPPKDP